MAKKTVELKPIEQPYSIQKSNVKSLVNFLRYWIKMRDLDRHPVVQYKQSKYAIGMQGLIIRGWGISELQKWSYEDVRNWYPMVKILERLEIVEIQLSHYLPEAQSENYLMVIPNLENLANAEAIIERYF